MARWISATRVVLVILGVAAMAACAAERNPVAPDSLAATGGPAIGSPVTAEQVTNLPEANVTLRGVIRQLNATRGVFVVVPQSGARDQARWVKVEPRTIIWTFDGTSRTRLRLTALSAGMTKTSKLP
jgi:hypothetical protein